eukprot:TRINITY_DN858_c0_g1_i1.p3 TRINITY_DN858_c0_g1~~TRINITY_DN858_c0_g1_i1.p3  ORF type:complete len:115 (+),score=31.27 TRINITY_DN858_c0_g1_i1:107-451(+)
MASTSTSATHNHTSAPRGSVDSFDFEVHGKVQGVFFRKYTHMKAVELKLVGFVQNTPQGTVVGTAQGSAQALAKLQDWLKTTGSPKSQIARCDIRRIRKGLAAAEFTNFSIKKD